MPKIHAILPAYQLVNETDSFEIFCNATGNPPPAIIWRKVGDGSKVFPVGKTLRILHADKADFGTYQCTAVSPRGENITSEASVDPDNCKFYVNFLNKEPNVFEKYTTQFLERGIN